MALARKPARGKKLPCGRPIKGAIAGCSSKLTDEDRQAISRKLDEHQQLKGLNRSEVRDNLLEAILQCEGHFSGPELIMKVHSLFPGIGAATIYRNLPIFIDAGVLRESLNDPSGQVIYELQGSGHHDHIVCLDCHAILEFHEDRIENLQQEMMDQLGFAEVQHRHVVYAHCEFSKKNRLGASKAIPPSYTSSVTGAV